MKSNLHNELNQFIDKFNFKFEYEEVIELEEKISLHNNQELYIKKVSSNLYKIMNSIFKNTDEIIFCVNVYKKDGKNYNLPLKLRRYLKDKSNINIIPSFKYDERIEHYYTSINYNNLKVKKLIDEIVRKDLGRGIDGLETVFIINKITLVAVILYDDRYVFVEK